MGDGIVAYKWVSDLDGGLSTEQTFSVPAASLSVGTHTITFTARDAEGNWAVEDAVTVMVMEELHRVYMPMVIYR